jgi:hypothetical protein
VLGLRNFFRSELTYGTDFYPDPECGRNQANKAENGEKITNSGK